MPTPARCAALPRSPCSPKEGVSPLCTAPHRALSVLLQQQPASPNEREYYYGLQSLRNGAFAMLLQQGELRGYDFNRSVVEFTMLNQGKVILCAISTAAMDDLEGRRDVRPDQRVDQFMRLREVIEERASRKFFKEQAQSDRPVVLRANDFSK